MLAGSWALKLSNRLASKGYRGRRAKRSALQCALVGLSLRQQCRLGDTKALGVIDAHVLQGL